MSEQLEQSGQQTDKDFEVVRACSPQDFDGHTEFHRLSPRQRLLWLDEAVAFIAAAKSSRRVTSLAPDRPTKSPKH